MQVNNLALKRSTSHSEDNEKYYTKDGFITKRKNNKLLGKSSNLTSCSSVFVKPENVKGLVHKGSYFEIGDRQSENKNLNMG